VRRLVAGDKTVNGGAGLGDRTVDGGAGLCDQPSTKPEPNTSRSDCFEIMKSSGCGQRSSWQNKEHQTNHLRKNSQTSSCPNESTVVHQDVLEGLVSAAVVVRSKRELRKSGNQLFPNIVTRCQFLAFRALL